MSRTTNKFSSKERECAERLVVDSEGQRVLNVDAKAAQRAIHLGMPQQQLNHPMVASLPVDLRHLGPAHRMRAIGARLEADRGDPPPDYPCILPGQKVRAAVNPARPMKLEADHFWVLDPARQG